MRYQGKSLTFIDPQSGTRFWNIYTHHDTRRDTRNGAGFAFYRPCILIAPNSSTTTTTLVLSNSRQINLLLVQNSMIGVPFLFIRLLPSLRLPLFHFLASISLKQQSLVELSYVQVGLACFRSYSVARLPCLLFPYPSFALFS